MIIRETSHMEVRRILKHLLARMLGVRSCQILDSEVDNEVKEILDLFYERKNKPRRW